MCPGYREVFYEANTVTESSELEINLISKYSHQNITQEISFKGPPMGSNCCQTELLSVKLISVMLSLYSHTGKSIKFVD